jgi:hypothetical protein
MSASCPVPGLLKARDGPVPVQCHLGYREHNRPSLGKCSAAGQSGSGLPISSVQCYTTMSYWFDPEGRKLANRGAVSTIQQPREHRSVVDLRRGGRLSAVRDISPGIRTGTGSASGSTPTCPWSGRDLRPSKASVNGPVPAGPSSRRRCPGRTLGESVRRASPSASCAGCFRLSTPPPSPESSPVPSPPALPTRAVACLHGGFSRFRHVRCRRGRSSR